MTKYVTAVLMQDVFSIFKKNNIPVCYGKKGERVKITYDSITALVVTRENGESFPVKRTHIKIDNQISRENEHKTDY